MSAAPTGSIQEQSLLIPQGSAVDIQDALSAGCSLAGSLPVSSWRYRYVKRAIDFCCAIILAALLLIPGAVIAAAILLTSKGPIFFRELRIGRDGRYFRIWKFRTMYQHAPRQNEISKTVQMGKILEWRMRKHLKDPRITWIGGFLRRWSLDEVPQVINVIRGEMSLVGPRPIVSSEIGFYGDLIQHYLSVTPGMSGLWQVSGRSTVDYDRRAMLDSFYVESWSLKSDFAILFRTLPAVLSRYGAA